MAHFGSSLDSILYKFLTRKNFKGVFFTARDFFKVVQKSGSYHNSKLISSRREIAKSCNRWLILVVVLALFYVIFNKKKIFFKYFRARDFLKVVPKSG